MHDPSVELLQRIRSGDTGAFDDLITRHTNVLRAHLRRYVSQTDAEDLLQELWLRVWQRAEQWQGGKPLARMLTIATNLALNHLRRRPMLSTAMLEEDELNELSSTPADALLPGPEEEVIWREEMRRVSLAMEMLPEEKQQTLRLIRIEGMSLREAADALGVPVGTVKSRLHHAHKLLMEYMEGNE